jgi:hypothetical protein
MKEESREAAPILSVTSAASSAISRRTANSTSQGAVIGDSSRIEVVREGRA